MATDSLSRPGKHGLETIREITISSGDNNMSSSRETSGIRLFGKDIDVYPRDKLMMFLIVGVFVTYIVFFILQEAVFSGDGFVFGGVVTLFETTFFSIMGFAERLCTGVESKRKGSLLFHTKVALMSVLGTAFSTYSLQALNFPTWVMFKSSRALAVMVVGVLFYRRTYFSIEYLGVLTLSAGLTLFTLGDLEVLPAFDSMGLVLVGFSLLFNAFLGQLQEVGMVQENISQNEMIVFSNAIGTCILIPYLLVKGELISAIWYFVENPLSLCLLLVAYPISYLGIVLVLTVLKCSDSLTAVIITSCRKAVTVILSFLLFSKPFSVNYVYGGILVFLAIWLTVTGQRERKASATDVVPIRLSDVSLKDFASLRPGKVHVV